MSNINFQKITFTFLTVLLIISISGCGITSKPEPVQSPIATANDGVATISWQPSLVAGNNMPTSYNIYWSTTPGRMTMGHKITGVTSPYSHHNRTNETTYYYIITAVNSIGESEPSLELLTTPGTAYTKLLTNRFPLANQEAIYDDIPWDCVQDNITGLMWEVKTVDSLLRDKHHLYSWYDNKEGLANGGMCADTTNCDTDKYVIAVNTTALCGYTDWRMPQKEALLSLVKFDFYPTIDVAYFPNTNISSYWSASTFDNFRAWSVDFFSGFNDISSKNVSFYVRLVRGSQ